MTECLTYNRTVCPHSLFPENVATINAEVGTITIICVCDKTVSTNFIWNNVLHGHCPLSHVKNKTASSGQHWS